VRGVPGISAGAFAGLSAIVFAIVAMAGSEPSQPVVQRNAVLELFTSQGSRAARTPLVVRPYLDVEVRRLPPGATPFVLALKSGESIGGATATALGEAPGFNLEANLAGLIESGAIVGIAPAPA